MHLLILSGDADISRGKKNAFFEMLSEFRKHWTKISIITPSNEIGKEIALFDNVRLYPSAHSRKMHLDFFLHKRFIIGAAGKIYAHDPFQIIAAHAIPPAFIQVEAGKTLHEIYPKTRLIMEIFHIPGWPRHSGFKELVLRLITGRYLQKTATLVSKIRVINNREVPEYLAKLGIIKNKIKVIPAFNLDFRIFKPLNLVKKNNRFIWVGRFDANKGIDLLIAALDIAKAEIPDIFLQIIGSGKLKNYLEKEVKNRNLVNNVEIIEWLATREELVRSYNESIGHIMTSYNEGGPRVSLEAMACGIPTISTKVGIVNEIIKSGINGFLVDWKANDIAKAIIWVAQNKAKAQKIGAAGAKTVAHFELTKSVSNYAESYRSI